MNKLAKYITPIVLSSLLFGCSSEAAEDNQDTAEDVIMENTDTENTNEMGVEELDANSLEGLIKEADLIVTAEFNGEMEEITYGENNGEAVTATIRYLEVKNTIAGNGGEEIQTIRLTGAHSDLDEGQYLLFLIEGSDLVAENTYNIFGLGQGTFRVTDNGDLERSGQSDTFMATFAEENNLQEAIEIIEEVR